MRKSTKVTFQGKAKNVKVDAEMVLRRALALSNARENVTMEMVFSMPIVAVPTALFTERGSMMRIKQKADLMHKLEEMCENRTSCPQTYTSNTLYIRDAMVECQKFQRKNFMNVEDFITEDPSKMGQHLDGLGRSPSLGIG